MILPYADHGASRSSPGRSSRNTGPSRRRLPDATAASPPLTRRNEAPGTPAKPREPRLACIHRFASRLGEFWIAQQPGSDDWWLGTDQGCGQHVLLGFYRTAQGAAAAVTAGLTGWDLWDHSPCRNEAPESLKDWSTQIVPS